MIALLFFLSLCCIVWGWSVSRRARENRERAIEMLRQARLGRVLEDAVDQLPTVERHLVETLPTSDPQRLEILHRLLNDLEKNGDLAPAEVNVVLDALDVAAGRVR